MPITNCITIDSEIIRNHRHNNINNMVPRYNIIIHTLLMELILIIKK